MRLPNVTVGAQRLTWHPQRSCREDRSRCTRDAGLHNLPCTGPGAGARLAARSRTDINDQITGTDNWRCINPADKPGDGSREFLCYFAVEAGYDCDRLAFPHVLPKADAKLQEPAVICPYPGQFPDDNLRRRWLHGAREHTYMR